MEEDSLVSDGASFVLRLDLCTYCSSSEKHNRFQELNQPYFGNEMMMGVNIKASCTPMMWLTPMKTLDLFASDLHLSGTHRSGFRFPKVGE